MSDFVRVRDKDTGHEFSYATAAAEGDERFEVLKDADAVDANGAPLPPTYNEGKTKRASGSTAATKES